MSTVMDMITAKNKEKMEQKKSEQAQSKETNGNPQLQRPKPMVSAMQPVRASDKEVLFRSNRPNFAFFLNGSRVQFKQGFYCTDDSVIIKYIKDNYVGSFVYLLEQGALKEQEAPAIPPNGEE